MERHCFKKNIIQERIGKRQGGYSSADEWKVYGNPMIQDIELHSQSSDYMANLDQYYCYS